MGTRGTSCHTSRSFGLLKKFDLPELADACVHHHTALPMHLHFFGAIDECPR
jgi:hypothetical protein